VEPFTVAEVLAARAKFFSFRAGLDAFIFRVIRGLFTDH
jgi:hypothetical protein